MNQNLNCPGKSETPSETMSETLSLKALARLVLERDTARDRERDRVSHRALGDVEAVRQSGQFPIGLPVSLALHSAPVLPIAPGEPGLQQPCPARRGRIQELDGVFLHYCCQCGRFGAFGYGVHLRTGRLGRWYCGEHRPQGFNLQID